MNKLTFVITTFKERSIIVKQLVKDIKSFHKNKYDIILLINSNNEEELNENYRKEMLQFSSEYENIYVFTLPEFKSLAKMWNTGVIFSRTEYNLILNDDIEYKNPDLVDKIFNHINSTNSQFFTINFSFSHFVITKTILHKLGYFDERFISFGEEDGDMVHRYIEMFNSKIENININNLINSNRHELSSSNLDTHVNNKPTVNRKIAEMKFLPDKNGIFGMSPKPLKKVWSDYQQYPYEMFFIKNKHNIKEFKSLDLEI